jgi:DNA-binding ferritin-like protein
MVRKYEEVMEECRVEENKQRIKQFKEDDERIKKRVKIVLKELEKITKEKNNG